MRLLPLGVEPEENRFIWRAGGIDSLMSPCPIASTKGSGLGSAVDQTGETGNFSGRSAGVENALTTNLGDDFLGAL